MFGWPIIRLVMVWTSIGETAYFYVSKTKMEKCKDMLEEIYKPDWVEFELQKTLQLFQEENTNKTMISELKNPDKRYLAMIGVYFFFVQQLAGINIVNFYSHTIFERAGVDDNMAS